MRKATTLLHLYAHIRARSVSMHARTLLFTTALRNCLEDDSCGERTHADTLPLMQCGVRNGHSRQAYKIIITRKLNKLKYLHRFKLT
jgi:hypothetical protein